MIFKTYFDVHPWTTQENIFFFSNNPGRTLPAGVKRYVAEIEVPDPDADIPRAQIKSVQEMDL